MPYSSLRYTAAALVFVALTFPRERSLRIGRADLPLVALAVVLLLVNQLSFVFALDLTTATTAALLFGTLPIFTALISRLVGIERLGRRFWIAASLSFAGVVLVTAGSGKSVSANLGGDLLAVLGAATWGGYSVAVRAAHAPLLAVPAERGLPVHRLGRRSCCSPRRSSETRASTSARSPGSVSRSPWSARSC